MKATGHRTVAFFVAAIPALLAGCSDPASLPFEDRSSVLGFDFTYDHGSTGQLYLAEIVGGGAALLDCDSDGDLDLALAQGEPLSLESPGGNALPRLFRNDLVAGEPGSLKLTDVTTSAGLTPGDYGVGFAAGDIDNDGQVDLYLTSFGRNRMFRGLGDCRFEAIDGVAADANWGVSASFLDIDRDGDLDLFLGNYVDHHLEQHRPCRNARGATDYCGPKAYQPQANRLWLNDGSGQFNDISQASGIADESGGALGVVAADFDDDGWPDIYVANDQRPNLLFRNTGHGRFENTALRVGCAVNDLGQAEASMGVDAGDADGDGTLDLFLSHLRRETNTLYHFREGQCTDRSMSSNLAAPSLAYTGFGTGFVDYDNDGDLDLFVANGDVEIISAQAQAGIVPPLRQRNQLFENDGKGNFNEIIPGPNSALAEEAVSRGVALGDLDNDGDTDLIVINSGSKAQALINQVGQDRNWLGISLWLATSDRLALGALATLERSDNVRMLRRVARDGSYASSNDPRIRFGLGDSQPRYLDVRWPDGRHERFTDLAVNRYHVLRQGTGKAIQS